MTSWIGSQVFGLTRRTRRLSRCMNARTAVFVRRWFTAMLATALAPWLVSHAVAQDRIYWADSEAGEVWRAQTDGSGAQAVLVGLSEPIDVVVDVCASQIYVADAGANAIWRADLDGGNPVVIVSGVGLGVTRLTLDHAGDRLYWTDNDPSGVAGSSLYRSTLSGSGPTPILGGLSEAAGIALDTINGYVYVAEYTPQRILRAPLNGGVAIPIVTGVTAGTPCSIALDIPSGRVYWADGGDTGPGGNWVASFIRSANLDGSNPNSQPIQLAAPNCSLAIDLETRKAYYSHDATSTELRRRNMDGTGPVEILYGGPAGLDNVEGMSLLLAVSSGRPYCTAGISSSGCAATISASGTPSVGATSGFTLTCQSVEGQKSGMLFYGISGAQAVAWGASSSYFCVRPPTQRTTAQLTGGTLGACDGVITLDFLSFVASTPGALGTPLYSGEVIRAQGWYRDPPSPKTTNLTNAIAWTMCP